MLAAGKVIVEDGASLDTMSEVPKPQVQEALERILASREFRSAERMCTFLRFIVHHKLDDEKDPLKEYVIADRVFGRGESFDPRTDTIVRVEARRLRAKLEKYYQNEGSADPVIIELSERGYTPTFRSVVPLTNTRAAATPPPTLPGLQKHKRSWLVVAGCGLVVLAAGIGTWLWLSAPEKAIADSIAVLPCDNLTGDSEAEYISDGLTEELISALAKIPSLRVTARTSSLKFKGGRFDVREIARDLGVQTVLECSVRKEGQRIRVTAKLASGKDGSYLLSETFDQQINGVLAVQTGITRSIVDTLQIHLSPNLESRLSSPETNSAEANLAYLKGRRAWDRGTAADLKMSIDYMTQAFTLDPKYSAAYSGWADALGALASFEPTSFEEIQKKTKWAAQMALQHNPGSAEGHWTLATVVLNEEGWDAADREFRLAIDLKPSFADARQAYAVLCLAPMRRYEEAISQLQEAIRLNPKSAVHRTFLGQTLTYASKPDDATTAFNDAIDLEPDYIHARIGLALANIEKKAYREALQKLKDIESSGSQHPYYWGLVGYAQAQLGDKADAEAIRRRLAKWAAAADIDIAGIYHGLGETTQALEWLEKAYQDMGRGAGYIIDDPRFRNLHSNPRFLSIIKRMDLSYSH